MQSLLTVIFICIITVQSSAQWFLQFSDPNPDVYIHHIDFISADTGWAVGQWEMLKTTTGGDNWDTLIVQPESNTTIQAISFVNGTTGWYMEIVADQNNCKIYKTTNSGVDWNLQYTSPQFTLMWDMKFVNQDIGYCVGYTIEQPVLWKTTDGGITWNMINIAYPNGPELFKLFFIDQMNGWAAGDGIYRTTDGGDTWIELINSFYLGIQDIQFITPDIGYYSDMFSVQKTTDGGYSWVPQTMGGDGWHTSSVYFIDADTGYFCPYDRILKTTDGGSSWTTQLLTETYNIPPNLIDIQFINANLGWALNYNPLRIFHTLNGGTPVELVSFTANVENNNVRLNWITATEANNRGFDLERQVHSLQSSVSKWEKIGFVEGNGTTTEQKEYSFIDKDVSARKYSYRLKQIDFDGSFKYSKEVEVEINTKLEFSLYQNFPNPFNPVTIINYQLPINNFVSLKVYNTLGAEVATLVNEEKPAGSYEVNFDGSKLSSGVYYYKIEINGFISVKKMILLR